MTQSNRYDSTRHAWETIWNEANIHVELEAVQSKRSLETINAYQPYLPHDDLILEAGSGLSAVVIMLRQRGYHVIGMDYAHNALEASLQYDDTLPLLTGDIHKIPMPDESIGAYLSFGVLEHFEHGMQPALVEANRILKRDGVLVLTIPYPNLVYRLVQVKRQITGQSTLTDEDFYESAYTKDMLIQAVNQAGFHVELCQPTSHSFTFWGVNSIFRGQGYYETSPLAETFGTIAKTYAPWLFNYMTLIVARKP